MKRLLADLQRLADLAQGLAYRQHGVRLLELADDLLGRMLLAFHREPPAAFHAALDSHNLWISFWGADQKHTGDGVMGRLLKSCRRASPEGIVPPGFPRTSRMAPRCGKVRSTSENA